MTIFNFISTENPELSEVYSRFKQGCLALGLPYDSLKQKKGYPKRYGEWIILKKKLVQIRRRRLPYHPYSEEKAKEIIKKHGLKDSTLAMWRSRNRIPDEYFEK